MKSFLLLFLIFLAPAITVAQLNLVPNCDFEQMNQCPFGVGNINQATGWLNFGESPEYFNSCAIGANNVPNTGFGYQYAHSGNGMAGLVAYLRPNATGGPNFREFIATTLKSSLQVNQKYYISFFVSCAGTPNIAFACNKIGGKLSVVSYDSINHTPINNFAQLYTDSMIADTLNWIKITGSFIADSAYRFLILGNFFDDQNTDTIVLSSFPEYAYYFIDDVCLSTDSIYAQTWTGLHQNNSLNNNKLLILNENKKLNIKADQIFTLVQIFDVEGRLMMNINNDTNSIMLDLLNFPDGIYIIRVRSINNEYISNKFIKF